MFVCQFWVLCVDLLGTGVCVFSRFVLKFPEIRRFRVRIPGRFHQRPVGPTVRRLTTDSILPQNTFFLVFAPSTTMSNTQAQLLLNLNMMKSSRTPAYSHTHATKTVLAPRLQHQICCCVCPRLFYSINLETSGQRRSPTGILEALRR